MFILKTEQKITPSQLLNKLRSLGYEYNTEANAVGLFSFRGDIVDFWSPQFKYPVRADFDFDKIKQLYLFDAYYGKKIEEKLEIKILNVFFSLSRRESKKIDISFIASLSPGDLIVHINHGIGKFSGITFKTIDNVKKEYFVLKYGGGDILYLPVEMADKIDKYVGPKPSFLHKLDRAAWEQVKIKTRQDIALFASELLEAYSKRSVSCAKGLSPFMEIEKQFADSFIYEETEDQKKAIFDVLSDLEKIKPMDRLIAGDVGFGKTEVAIRAAFRTFLNKAQTALLCPTTILAQQHFDTFEERFNQLKSDECDDYRFKYQSNKKIYCFDDKKYIIPDKPKIVLLSRFQSKKMQKEIVQKICSGEIDIVIATHRLLSSDVKFKNLGLLIVDEEQKFGVAAKEKLKKIRPDVHILSLSATPIPRSLNLSLSGLRNFSLINTPPLGRLPIKTFVEKYDSQVIKTAISLELKRGGQVYYLFNQVQVMEIKKREIEKLLNDLENWRHCSVSIQIAHGQMPSRELARVMHQFDKGKIDILLCSTIIENGLDLPNVNTLIAENAENLGLSQSYQLRGRIGRGVKQAYAYFFYNNHKAELPDQIPKYNPNMHSSTSKLPTKNYQPNRKSKAKDRLKAIQDFADLGSGFKIAMRDLEIRGAGAILGKKQHGPIGAVGLGLYLTILNEEIEKLKIQSQKREIFSNKDSINKANFLEQGQQSREVNIDLPIEYSIPKNLEPNEVKRIELYHKLAQINNLSELEENFKNLLLCQEKGKIKNLFNLFKIKILANKIDIESIIYQRFNLQTNTNETRQGCLNNNKSSLNFRIIVKFRNQVFPPKLLDLIKINPAWQVGNETIKIYAQDLGQDWFLSLSKNLEMLI